MQHHETTPSNMTKHVQKKTTASTLIMVSTWNSFAVKVIYKLCLNIRILYFQISSQLIWPCFIGQFLWIFQLINYATSGAHQSKSLPILKSLAALDSRTIDEHNRGSLFMKEWQCVDLEKHSARLQHQLFYDIFVYGVNFWVNWKALFEDARNGTGTLFTWILRRIIFSRVRVT